MFWRVVTWLSILGLAGCAAGPQSLSGDNLKFYQVVPQSYQGQSVPQTNDVQRLQAPQNQAYYFKANQTQLRPVDIAAINAQAKYLVQHPDIQVLLAGHTDARGSASYNLALGWQRAEAMAKQLALLGVKPDQIHVVSFGGSQPAVLGRSLHVWQLNNRVNLIYEVSDEASS